MFSGSMVALVTPFNNGQVDWPQSRGAGRVSPGKRHQRPRPVRHDRRVGDAQHEEHVEVVRTWSRVARQTRAGHRRHRLQLDG